MNRRKFLSLLFGAIATVEVFRADVMSSLFAERVTFPVVIEGTAYAGEWEGYVIAHGILRKSVGA
jgi:hypothetical protein